MSARRSMRPRRWRASCVGCSRSPVPIRACRWTPTCDPKGRQGPLVRSLASYCGLLRTLVSRVGVAGAAARGALGRRSEVWPRGSSRSSTHCATRREACRRRRRRRGTADQGAGPGASGCPRGVDRAAHVKLGPGGLADVEWTVQLLQLRHAHGHPGPAHHPDAGCPGRPQPIAGSSIRPCARARRVLAAGDPAAKRVDAGPWAAVRHACRRRLASRAGWPGCAGTGRAEWVD